MSGWTPERHNRLSLLLTAAAIGERLGDDAAFLADYTEEVRRLTGWAGDAAARRARLDHETAHLRDLPLRRLTAAGGGPGAIDLLLTVALAGEDPRIAALLGDGGFAEAGALVALWRFRDGEDDPLAARQAIAWLLDTGLLLLANPEAPRHAHAVSLNDAVFDVLTGVERRRDAFAVTATEDLPRTDDLIAPPALAARLPSLARLIAEAPETMLCLRGPERNGRHHLAKALARAAGRPVVTASGAPDQTAALRQAAIIAYLRGAVLVVNATAPAGEPRTLPAPPLEPLPTILIAGEQGSIAAGGRPLVTIAVPMPGESERHTLWRRAAPAKDEATLAQLAATFRVTSGAIVDAAAAALAVEGRLTPETVRQALRDLQDGRLEGVAHRIDIESEEEFLALEPSAHAEMELFALRCRHREQLADHAGPGPGRHGLRALFSGPSGAGKTLAARCLARTLAKDLWRIDLAAAVSKYIGETEKTLDRAFAAAEARDVVLLLDEGDALMARRTDIGNANDRYANLETNFLLQRIESFSGILIVTSNAGDRIDGAFQRRMDVVVPFQPPDELRRYQILLHHLGEHRTSDDLIQEIAVRCTLSGGQLRNVALHARLLALEAGGTIGDRELRSAIEREYRKQQGYCPLKPLLAAVH